MERERYRQFAVRTLPFSHAWGRDLEDLLRASAAGLEAILGCDPTAGLTALHIATELAERITIHRMLLKPDLTRGPACRIASDCQVPTTKGLECAASRSHWNGHSRRSACAGHHCRLMTLPTPSPPSAGQSNTACVRLLHYKPVVSGV